MKMSSVVHFEMPAEDRKRMADFYTRVFGWKTQQLGEDMGNYVVVSTAETEEDGRMKQPGAINGGFYQKTKDVNQHPSVVIGVENIKEAMKNVAEAGGKIIGGQKPGEPDEIPGVGLFASFIDTEGNRVSMLEPKMDGMME